MNKTKSISKFVRYTSNIVSFSGNKWETIRHDSTSYLKWTHEAM